MVAASRQVVELTSAESGRLISETSVLCLPLGAIEQHGPHLPLNTDLVVAEGLTLAECDALADWRKAAAFSAAERAALAYADAMVTQTSVPDDVFAELKRHYDARAIVEISVLIGTYLMHNRVFTALKVDVEPKKN